MVYLYNNQGVAGPTPFRRTCGPSDEKGTIPMKRSAFTLVELLVVIAIIALLMAILMPALNMAKDQGRRVHCISNVRSLTLAWLLYKDDNDSKLVNGHVPGGAFAKGTYWVEPPQTTAGAYAGRPATREEEIRGIQRGLLFQYAKTIDLYRCPSDSRKSNPTQDAWRSFSVAGGANGEVWSALGYTTAITYLDIRNPATKYVFVEETDGRGWNIGSWVMNVSAPTWVDPLSIWHSKSRSTLGWADGRAEMHTWVDASTKEMSQLAIEGSDRAFNYPIPAGQYKDVTFMKEGFPRK